MTKSTAHARVLSVFNTSSVGKIRRGAFTMKLTNLKLRGPSLALVYSKGLGGPMVISSHGHIILKYLQK